MTSRVFISLVTGLEFKESRDLFPSQPFTLPMSLSCATPNQTMKLTATVQRSGDAFLIARFLSLRVSLSAGGRSLSFSR
jgi:hypothetical protein